MRLDRSFYVPAGSRKIASKHCGMVVYLFNTDRGEPALVSFHGKQSKPTDRYRFKSDADREKWVRTEFERYTQFEAASRAHRESLKGPHSLQIGDILYTSGGYDQTRVSFFQVVSATASMIKMYPIRKEQVGEGSWSNWRVAPVPGTLVKTVRKWMRDESGEEVCRDVPCDPIRVRIDAKDRGTYRDQCLALHCRAGEPVGSRGESGHH